MSLSIGRIVILKHRIFSTVNLLQIVSHYSLDMSTNRPVSEAYIQELPNTAHPRRCIELLQMPLATFLALEKWLVSETSLKRSRKGVSE